MTGGVTGARCCGGGCCAKPSAGFGAAACASDGLGAEGVGGVSAACFCGGGAGGGGLPAGGAAAGGGELEVAALAALAAWEDESGFDERSRESGAFSFGVGGSSGAGSDAFATSSGATMSTAIGSAVTALKGWTSAKKISSNRHDKCASADAVMPDFRI